MQPPRFLVRAAVTAFQRIRRALWFVYRPHVRGVMAVPVTPEGKIVLVRLTYDRGWHLPGGGIKSGETPEQAALRELEEEIGLIGHGAIACLGSFEHRPDRRRGTATAFLVRDVRYDFRPSIEIDEVRECDPGSLPEDISPLSARKIAEARPQIA
jgi:8-oxo-dGTP pyrophosphatase MutT (NUDIX family)